MSSRSQVQVTGSSHVSCRRRCRMQRVRGMVRAWKQWCLFKHYQQVAAGALRRKHLAHHALQCWRLEWLPRATAKQQLAQQQAYKVSILHCSGLCKNKEGPQRIQSYQLYNNLAGYTATRHASHHVHADVTSLYLSISLYACLLLSWSDCVPVSVCVCLSVCACVCNLLHILWTCKIYLSHSPWILLLTWLCS